MSDEVSRDGGGRDSRFTVRAVIAVVLVIVLVALIIDNHRSVRVGWVVGDTRLPLALLLALAAVAGALIGWLLMHRPGRDHDD
jgi:uncharacterized integral membrane protein